MSRLVRAVAILAIASSSAAGQLAYTGGSLTQDFNTLPSAGTTPFAGLLAGWVSTRTDLVAGTGSSNAGALYSFGATGSGERALGSVASGGTGPVTFGLWLTNATGQTLTEFSLAYTGEQWRRGDGSANLLQFAYGLGATSLTMGSYVDVAALSFTAPVATGANAALDGNNAANRTGRSQLVTGLQWGAGQSLWLRWQDENDTGADDGIAIDDITFSARTTTVVPEPGTLSLLLTAVGLLAFIVIGRHRRGA